MPKGLSRCLAGALFALMATARAQQASPLPPGLAPFVRVNAPVVALAHVTVVDGTGAPARTDQTVILDGTQIGAAGPFASTTIPPGAQVLDLAGHTVLPGLVGLHEHTYFGGVARVTPMNVSGPLLYLAYGVTTAMTAGSMLPYHEVSLKRAVDTGETPGPRFLIAGPYLDGDDSRNPMSLKVATPEAARRAVAYWSAEGATWIKFLGREKREVLRAGIEEAHARGMRVTGHLCSVTFTEAAALGIGLLQHGLITNTEYLPGKQPDICPAGNQRLQADVDVSSPDVQASIRHRQARCGRGIDACTVRGLHAEPSARSACTRPVGARHAAGGREHQRGSGEGGVQRAASIAAEDDGVAARFRRGWRAPRRRRRSLGNGRASRDR